jgi:hypothetical protein
MKPVARALTLAALVGLSTAAAAQQPPRFYGSIAGGKSDWGVSCATTSSACDKGSTAMKAVAGWRFAPGFALEGGWHNFGKSRVADATTSLAMRLSGPSLSLALHQPWGPQWQATFRVGAGRLKTNIDASVVGFGSASDSRTRTTLVTGWALGYRMSENLSLDFGMDYARSNYVNAGGDVSSSVSMWGLGLSFGF